jgi:hypothetical protein
VKNHVFRSDSFCFRWWVALVALAFVQIASAQNSNLTNPPDQWYNRFTTTGGKTVWTAPGGTVTSDTITAARAQAILNTIPSGVEVVQTGNVLLPSGTPISLIAKRAITVADIFAGAKAALGGPVGIAVLALSALPEIIDWVNKDGATTIRVNSSNNGFEKRNKDTKPPGTGYQYQGYTSAWFNDPDSACKTYTSYFQTAYAPTYTESYVGEDGDPASGQINCHSVRSDGLTNNNPSVTRLGGCPVGQDVNPDGSCSAPTDQPWLPASMDDIAPYLFPYPPPTTLVYDILNHGVNLPAANESVSGPSTTPTEPSVTDSEKVPVPPNIVTSSTTPGNPLNLAANTPTVTSSGTGSTPASVNGTPVNVPNSTSTTSTYNPTSNSTTSTTTTTSTPVRVDTTTTPKTTVAYTPTTATATTTNTTVINIVNNNNNTVISTTTNTNNPPPKLPDTPDPCKTDPNLVSCTDLGTAPDASPLPRTSKAFSMTAETFAASGACPPPVSFSIGMRGFSGSYAISYQPACDVMAMLRDLIIALGAFAAAYVLADSFKVT